MEHNQGGKLHPKPNIGLGPIANKSHEGVVKIIWEQQVKVPEIVEIGIDEIVQHL